MVRPLGLHPSTHKSCIARCRYYSFRERTTTMANNPVRLAESVMIGHGRPLALIAGPCVIESHEETLLIAERLADIGAELGMPIVFKASFDKANRSSIHGFRGPGL